MIAAGGTAGHVVPALAVADALRADGARRRLRRRRARRARARARRRATSCATIAVEGLSRTNPLQGAARAALKAGGAVRAAGRLLDELRPAAVMGGGGYVAGPVGLAAVRRRIPLVLTEADSHLGLTNRLLARSRAARLPGLPDRGARRRALPRHRPAGAAAGRRPRRRARSASGWPTASAACSCLRRLARGAHASTRPRSRRSARATRLPRPARRRPSATSTDAAHARARPALRPARLHRRASRDALAAADLVVARAGGSIFEIAAARHARRSSSRTRTPPATTRPATRAGWTQAGAARRRAGRRADRASACAREVGGAARRPRAAGAHGRALGGAGASARRRGRSPTRSWRPEPERRAIATNVRQTPGAATACDVRCAALRRANLRGRPSARPSLERRGPPHRSRRRRARPASRHRQPTPRSQGATGSSSSRAAATSGRPSPTGRAVRALTSTPAIEEAQAAWSPDGRRIAFRVGTPDTSEVLQIATMNADGSGRTTVTERDQPQHAAGLVA